MATAAATKPRKRTGTTAASRRAAEPSPAELQQSVDALAGITVPADPDVEDFSITYKPIKFRVNGPDVFEAVPVLPVPVLRELGAMHGSMEQLSTIEKFNKVLDMFDLLLTPESAKRFRARLESREDPDGGGAIDLNRQVIPILNWLVEKFGMRPTGAAGSSSDGAGSTGDSSTAGPPAVASTRRPSKRRGS